MCKGVREAGLRKDKASVKKCQKERGPEGSSENQSGRGLGGGNLGGTLKSARSSLPQSRTWLH